MKKYVRKVGNKENNKEGFKELKGTSVQKERMR